MTKKLLCKNNIKKIGFLGLFFMMNSLLLQAQTPPAPTGNADQYFCSATSWMNGGFTKPGDTFEELYIQGENLTFYDSSGNVISNPSSYTLVDGETYEVTQTVSGVESAPLTINVTDRECGCLKNPDFETIDGQPSGDDYTFYNQDVDDGHKTCNGSTAGLTSVAMSAVDATANNSVATLVTPGPDPNAPINRVNPNTPNSQYALRINDPTSGLDTSHMEKEFVAGEVISFDYAFVLNDPDHDPESQPYVNIALYDQNGDLFAQRCVISQPSDCILIETSGAFLYSEWSCIKINTLDVIGEKARMVITTSDCDLQVHQGYLYVDNMFVGDNADASCQDPGFGYLAMESVEASESSLDCVVDVQGNAQSCGADIDAAVPFPIEVCGSVKEPVSNSNPASIQDLTLDITKNGNLVGTVGNPTINGDQFCFTINESDINIQDAYGPLEISTEVNFTLDCGVPYGIVISDRANVDICPTAGCVAPLSTCDDTGTGIGTFDLTQTAAQIRGTQWTPADVDVTYYETEDDAVLEQNVISDPDIYNNSTPFNQIVYARLDWTPQGTATSCYYIIQIDVNVYKDPDVNIPSELASCNSNTFNVPIVATPDNVNELTDVTYTWKRNNQILAFSGSYYEATQPGIYEVTVEEQNCSVTKTVEVLAVDYQAKVSDDNIVEICGTNARADLEVEVIDNSKKPMDMSEVTYLWSTGQTTKEIEVTQEGNYFVDVMYKNCIQTTAVTVILNKQPEVEVGEDLIICKGQDVTLSATIQNYDDTSDLEFNWKKDGTPINKSTQIIEVNQPGDYTVEVNEIGTPDCIGVDEINVSNYANENCVITQGISPGNLDGFNDCLDLTFLNDRSGIAKLTLFNRYGRIIYEETDYVNSWCGQDQDGNDLPTGTYYYVIQLDQNDPVFENNIKGWIYVNREVN
ncbi:T9SS type B sorting domain-containing protein [Mesonia maritima]|uniref:Gliding motility-associated-like protein n=1 Tax=Mesonia maritima TaxID=1793873 RepID=A0ABU1KBQ9_9FLAO|nr:gliding motility-associated C-terminal domain-containing protein [Mesonia maritima]MDR6302008.1 gliding motility-associated-like protein [Mesonia maritima]